MTQQLPEHVPVREHQARLVRLAYTILSPMLGQRRQVVARVAVEQALRSMPEGTPDYPQMRACVVRRALATGRRRGGPNTTARSLREARPDASANELASLLPAARAAYARHHNEGLDRTATHAQLAQAGVGDPAAATTQADARVVRP
ncbi:MAG: hypothetical protein ACT4QG_09380, partial [Sporichthyaceae bacterium]